MTKVLLISVKPRYARALLSGRKTVEVRRRFPKMPDGTAVVLYSSSPERAILGTVRLKRTKRVQSSLVWELYARKIDIGEQALNQYLQGAVESTILEVHEPDTWDSPVPLSELRELLGVEPPQSFRYLASEQLELIRKKKELVAS